MDRPACTDSSVEGLFVKNVHPHWPPPSESWTFGWMTGRRGSQATNVYEVRTTDGRLLNVFRSWVEVINDT